MKSSTKGKVGKITETGEKAVGTQVLETEGKRGTFEEKLQEKIGDVKRIEKNEEVLLISRHNLGKKE